MAPWRGKPSARIRLAVYEKSGFACARCQWQPFIPDGYDGAYCLTGRVQRRNGTWAQWTLDLDHIRPYSSGGLFKLDNLQALCSSCNAKKGAKVDA